MRPSSYGSWTRVRTSLDWRNHVAPENAALPAHSFEGATRAAVLPRRGTGLFPGKDAARRSHSRMGTRRGPRGNSDPRSRQTIES